MITIEQIFEKKKFYIDKLNEINSQDINIELNKRLEALKPKLLEEIKQDFEKDVIACKHYLEILDDLIQDEENKTEEVKEEIKENIEGEINNEL